MVLGVRAGCFSVVCAAKTAEAARTSNCQFIDRRFYGLREARRGLGRDDDGGGDECTMCGCLQIEGVLHDVCLGLKKRVVLNVGSWQLVERERAGERERERVTTTKHEQIHGRISKLKGQTIMLERQRMGLLVCGSGTNSVVWLQAPTK